MTNQMVKSDSSEIVREEFGANQIEKRREVSQAAMVAQATAQIQAQYIMAKQNPRSWMDVRTRLLGECKRAGFAETAIYAKPQRMKNPKTGRWEDGFIEGLSIRFAEAAQRVAGNIRSGALTFYDDDEKRILNVYAIDLETNAILEYAVTVSKVVERSDPKDRPVLAKRFNSGGDPVYLVECTDEEFRSKEHAAVSREKRNLVLAIIPGDIREEAQRECKATKNAAVKIDPDAERKKIADAFAELKVMPSDLAAYLGHDLAQTTPAELERLRGIFAAIREGEAVWHDFTAEKDKPAEEQVKTTQAKKLAETIRARKGGAAPPADNQSTPSVETKPASPAATSGPASSNEQPGTVVRGICAICGKPTGSDALATLRADGSAGVRHPDCSPFTPPAETSPPNESPATATAGTAAEHRAQAAKREGRGRKTDPEPPFGISEQEKPPTGAPVVPTRDWESEATRVWKAIEAATNLEVLDELAIEVKYLEGEGAPANLTRPVRNLLEERRKKYGP